MPIEPLKSFQAVRYKDAYKKLVVWKNARELRQMVYEITADFSKEEFRRVSQMRDAARSVKQNIQEGRKRISEAEFLRFLDIARASLAELKGDIEDCREDSLLTEDRYQFVYILISKTDFLFHRLMSAISDAIGRRARKP